MPTESLKFDGTAQPVQSAVSDDSNSMAGNRSDITDLEKLAEDDPEHDPLKTIPASPEKPSPIKKIVVGSVAAVAVIVIIVGGVFVVRAKKEAQQESAAIAMCEKARSKYSEANEILSKAIRKAETSQKLTDSQVADASTLTKLRQSVKQGEQFGAASECSTSLAQSVLQSRARSMSKHSNDMKEQAATIIADVKSVEDSKKTLEANQIRDALGQSVSGARTLLDSSAWQVADNSTRDALSQAIDAAQKLIDGNSVDAKAMQEASKAISTASDAVNASMKAAQEAAAAQAQAQRAQAQQAQQAQQYWNPSRNNGDNGDGNIGSDDNAANAGDAGKEDDGAGAGVNGNGGATSSGSGASAN
ncbi:sugar-binding domain-containing protein [Bifidobacterium adolescentis]|uniref:Sugar-binding domain-containing protein n=1 Tax=Bifidobacterium adolescentis TaxID=1680 RepID=A0A1X2ZPU3_BIFAD|nr:sugar-binding domain-containing protein [Bifidobacterium adolescentis]